MYIITYYAINNDTDCGNWQILRHNIGDEEEPDWDILFKEIPDDLEKVVENTYDGVWEPDIDNIIVYKVKEIDWRK